MLENCHKVHIRVGATILWHLWIESGQGRILLNQIFFLEWGENLSREMKKMAQVMNTKYYSALREEIIKKTVSNSSIPLNIPLVLFFWTIPSLPSPSHHQHRNMQCSHSSKSVIFSYFQNVTSHYKSTFWSLTPATKLRKKLALASSKLSATTRPISYGQQRSWTMELG